jgi:hypothetical protein
MDADLEAIRAVRPLPPFFAPLLTFLYTRRNAWPTCKLVEEVPRAEEHPEEQEDKADREGMMPHRRHSRRTSRGGQR